MFIPDPRCAHCGERIEQRQGRGPWRTVRPRLLRLICARSGDDLSHEPAIAFTTQPEFPVIPVTEDFDLDRWELGELVCRGLRAELGIGPRCVQLRLDAAWQRHFLARY